MKIVRENQTIELTEEELRKAYEEQHLIYMMQDISDAYADMEISEEIELSEEDLKKIAEEYFEDDCEHSYNENVANAISAFLTKMDDTRSVFKVSCELRLFPESDPCGQEWSKELTKSYKGTSYDDVLEHTHDLVTELCKAVKHDCSGDLMLRYEKNGEYKDHDTAEIVIKADGNWEIKF